MIPLHDDNPTRGRPVVNYLLIGACVAAFAWQLSAGAAEGDAVLALAFHPAALFRAAQDGSSLGGLWPIATIFTSMFLHGGFLHLAGNMLYLWIFGDNVEDRLGHVRYLAFYFASGAAAALAQALSDPDSAIPMVGASGAISGVLGAYILMFPRARVLSVLLLGFFVRFIRVPSWVLLGLWFALQFLSAALSGPQTEGGVAVWAHLGGFAAGLVLLPLIRPRQPEWVAPVPRRGPWGERP